MAQPRARARLRLTSEQRALVEGALSLVPRVVASLRARAAAILGDAECTSLAHDGLVEAAGAFDPSLGVPFGSFAWLRMQGSILDGVRREARHRKWMYAGAAAARRFLSTEPDESDPLRESDDEAEARLGELAEGALVAMLEAAVAEGAGGEDDALERHALERVQAELCAARAGLSERDAAILEQHYRDERDLKDIARELGVSYASVRRYHKGVLGRLAVRLRERGLGPEVLPR
jgi:RNA polymerase sigma factor for flagellar operon FliA